MNGISFKISALDDFSSTMNKLEGKMKGITDSVGSFGRTISGIGAAGSAAVGAMMGVGIQYNAMLEKSSIAWETLLGSQEKAVAFQEKLLEMGKESPFDYESFDKSAKLLTAMGVESGKVLPMMTTIGDSVAAVGGNSETLERVGLAFAQMSAKGKVSAEEMNQLAENGIPAWKLLSEQTGMSVQDLMKLGEEGKLFADTALPAIMKGLEKSFGGGMEKATDSYSGQLEKMRESTKIALAKLSMPLFENMKEMLPKINSAIEKLTNWFTGLPKPMQKMITMGLVLAPILTILAGGFLMLVGFLPSIVAGFSLLGTAMSFALGPVGLIIAGIIALGAAFIYAYKEFDWFRNDINAGIKAVADFFGAQIAKIKQFWKENGAEIMEVVRFAMTYLAGIIRTQMAIIKGVFIAIWPILKATVLVTWNIIKLAISNALDFILGMIKFWSKLLNGDWRGALDALKETARNIMGNIVNFFKGINLREIGRDIIRGLIDGIKSMAGDVGKSVASIAKSIPSGVKKMLDIHSPSRVMMSLGGYTAEGLALGIGKGINGIQRMAGAMANAAVPNVNGPSLSYGMASASSSDASATTNASDTFNFEGMFAGAQFNVRNDNDVKAIAREIYNMTQNAKARRGIK